MRWLLAQAGLAGARSLAEALIERRAEWQAWLAAHDGLDGVFAHLESFFGADREAPVDALAQDATLRAAALELAKLLGQGTEAQQRKAVALEMAASQ
ncbi:hypothetical protein NK983_26425, partial [Salmonella enterica subsp. enterica serovar Typhimurium]|nr:hypothetical protein [Salmonella enterica subsp. enterica serovar Typhimurium]